MAAVLEAPRVVRLEAVAPPQPGDGEVLVEIEGCGVCASSLPVWEGRPWFDYPLPPGAPGHEAWGRTDDGGRVAFLTQHGFAPVAAVDARTLVPLPRELDGLPFPGEALACAVNVFARAGVLAGQRVAIVGMGFMGSAIAQLCEAAGAEVVALRRGDDAGGLACERVIETGGVQINLVPKEGGNTFHSYFSGSFTNDKLQQSNLDDTLRARGLTATPGVDQLYDAALGVGGRIVRDKLWFYAAARYWGSSQFQAGNYFNSSTNPLVYVPDLSRPAVSATRTTRGSSTPSCWRPTTTAR